MAMDNPALKQLRDTFKRKGNSLYEKMIEDLVKHERTTFTTNEDLVDQSFRSSFFGDLEEIHGTFEIREHKTKGEYHSTLSMRHCRLPARKVADVGVLL